MFFILMILTVTVSGCKSTNETLNANTVYRKDLTIYHEEKSYDGFAVLDKKDEYEIRFKSFKKPDVIRITNCHRDELFRDVKKKFKYSYEPNQKIEDGACFLEVNYIDEGGHNQFASISFVDDETLNAKVSCSGSIESFSGASACQAKSGTIQMIEFDSEVDVRLSDGCNEPETEDNKSFLYVINKDYCLYVFRDDEEEFHRHITYGYDEIIRK